MEFFISSIIRPGKDRASTGRHGCADGRANGCSGAGHAARGEGVCGEGGKEGGKEGADVDNCRVSVL